MTLRRFAAFLVAVSPLCAGIRIQAVSTDLRTKTESRQEILLDTARLRVNLTEAGTRTSMLFLTDGGRNRMLVLDPARNEYREMDEQSVKQMASQMQGAMAQIQEQLRDLPPEQRAMMEGMMRGRMGQMAPAAPQPTIYTAKGSGQAGGFACTNYEGMRGSEKVAEVCAATPAALKFSAADFQVFEKMREFTSALAGAMADSPFAGAALSQIADTGYEGFPVLQTTFEGGRPTQRTELKLIERADFSDADFSLGNARRVEMMPAGRGAR